MSKFSYTAKSPTGEEKTGVIEAKDSHQLAKTLKQQGFILIKAELAEEKQKLNLSFSFGGVSLTEKMMFTRNLQVMISSGLALPKAIQTLALQTKHPKFKKALLSIKEEIIKGKSFSNSLESHPSIFSELFRNMIKVGEEAGTLDEVLKILSRQMEREHELKAKITNALMYPAIIVLAMVGIGILMLVMVVPKLAATFEELEIELPVTTRVVIGIGEFLANNWLLAILFLVGFLFFGFFALKNKKVKKIVDAIFLRIPIIAPLVKKTNSAVGVRTLSSLIASGVPIVRSLEIVAGTLGNAYYKESMLEASEKVKKGLKLSDALKEYKNLYPLIVFQMIQVGEETGETSSILAKLAEFFEEEIGNATKNLAAVLEPVIMLVIGAAIGFFAISMVQPMYSMLGSI